MAWVDNGDGTISKKADPVLEGYNSYAEVRHTLSMGIKVYSYGLKRIMQNSQ